MTDVQIISQVLNLIGSGINITGISVKNKQKILLCFIFGNFFVALSLFLLKAYSGMIVQIIFIIETLINYFWEKKFNSYPIWLIIIYVVLPCTIIAVTFREFWDIFPLLSAILFPIAMLSKNFYLRLLNLISVLVWIPYNYHFAQYVGVACCIVFAIVNIVSIIRFDIIKKN